MSRYVASSEAGHIECADCGALIGNTIAHDRWHEMMALAARRAQAATSRAR